MKKGEKMWERPPAKLGYKYCSSCRGEKELSEFGKYSVNKDGHRYQCKECEKRPRILKKKIRKIVPAGFKICSCEPEVLKPLTEFYKNRANKGGHDSWCKKCDKISVEKYKKANIESIKTYKAKWYQDNKGDLLVKSNIRSRNRRREDKLYKLRRSISGTIKNSFKTVLKGSCIKSKTTETILGCKFTDFKIYIESQFLPGMSWENYGLYNGKHNFGWDLDHIVPASFAKTEEELYLLNHWSNFQPLCSKVNRDEKVAKLYPVTNLKLRKTFE